jgi:hypothetical protein
LTGACPFPWAFRISFHRTLGFIEILILALHPILILGTYAAEGIPLFIGRPLAYGFGSFLLLLLAAGSPYLSARVEGKWENWHPLNGR